MNYKKKMTQKERNEKLTNWYLINLTWGITGIIVLLLISKGYNNASTILAMQPMMWAFTAIFAIAAIALFAIGKAKNSARISNYAVFSGICGFVALWVALYNKIRPLLENVVRTVLSNPNLTVSSYWNVRIPMIAIAIYLVVSFIWFAIKVTRK